MNNEDDYRYLEKKVSDLEDKFRLSRIIGLSIIIPLYLVLFCLNLGLTMSIIKFERIFNEMLEGEPLPVLTEWVFRTGYPFAGLDITLFFILLGLFAFGERKYFAIIITCTIIFLVLKAFLIILACFMPLLNIVTPLGGG